MELPYMQCPYQMKPIVLQQWKKTPGIYSHQYQHLHRSSRSSSIALDYFWVKLKPPLPCRSKTPNTTASHAQATIAARVIEQPILM